MAPYSAVDAINLMNAVILPGSQVTAQRSIWVVLAIAFTLVEIATIWAVTATLT